MHQAHCTKVTTSLHITDPPPLPSPLCPHPWSSSSPLPFSPPFSGRPPVQPPQARRHGVGAGTANVPEYEIWDPAIPSVTQQFPVEARYLAAAKQNYYPFVYVLPNGDVFMYQNRRVGGAGARCMHLCEKGRNRCIV
eukprot:362917-Chlamydomonas_euryale.AAC.10